MALPAELQPLDSMIDVIVAALVQEIESEELDEHGADGEEGIAA